MLIAPFYLAGKALERAWQGLTRHALEAAAALRRMLRRTVASLFTGLAAAGRRARARVGDALRSTAAATRRAARITRQSVHTARLSIRGAWKAIQDRFHPPGTHGPQH